MMHNFIYVHNMTTQIRNMLKPKYKIQYNYSNTNDIPELLMAYSVVVDGEFLLKWCKCFGQLHVCYVIYVPKLAVVHQLQYVAQYELLI